ncbi:MAG: prolyl oligopeptidase family serine peptidase, partial [Bacteroidales bacterium]|nr:prolyl oligopeptidase family serine peptidase [Bacteroidales bacterium]
NANHFPWNDPGLFTRQSPLYNADKVKTPILLLHGNKDTNVPTSESRQFFTALTLLGKEVTLVEFDGQDHQILEYNARIKWQNTIFAWFDKWLKDQPEWWSELYPERKM